MKMCSNYGYDVFAIRNGKRGALLMTAPMAVISAAFELHSDATERVVLELDHGPYSIVHFNGKPSLLDVEAILIEP